MTLLRLPFVSIREALRQAAFNLEKEGIPSARLEADVLLAHLLGTDRLDLYKNSNRLLSAFELSNFEALLKKRISGVPTAYLRGKKEFFSLVFDVGEGVLIPRADSEVLVEEALKLFAKEAKISILDLGTGSGALIIATLLYYSNATGIAVDCSAKALEYAQKNAKRHGVENRLQFFYGSWFNPIPPSSLFDLILSNPPYIPSFEISSELRFEPREALEGGVDGMASYRAILSEAWKFMRPQSYLILEIGNLPEIPPFYKVLKVQRDLSGKDRVLLLQKI
jgi:release factor glutamine methyltransferase